MPSVIVRIVAKVTALLPTDWVGKAGKRFRQTLHEVGAQQDLSTIAAEGAKRFAVGTVSRDHAEALKHYAEEEAMRANLQLLRATHDARVRQENARAQQEEARAEMAQMEMVMQRIKLLEECHRVGAVPVFDSKGNIRILKAPPSFDWDKSRDRLATPEDVKLFSEPGDESEE